MYKEARGGERRRSSWVRFVIGKVWKQLERSGSSWQKTVWPLQLLLVGDMQLPPRSPSNSIWNTGLGEALTACIQANHVFPCLQTQTQQLLGRLRTNCWWFSVPKYTCGQTHGISPTTIPCSRCWGWASVSIWP